MKNVQDALPLLQPHQLLLGVDQNGIIINQDPTSLTMRSWLAIGDSGCGKTHLLRQAAISALEKDVDDSLRIIIATQKPEEWTDIRENRTVSLCVDPSDEGFGKIIKDITSYISDVGKEPFGRYPLNTLLLIDDIFPFIGRGLRRSSTEYINQFGPRSQTYIIGTLDYNCYHKNYLEGSVLLFQQLLLGRMPFHRYFYIQYHVTGTTRLPCELMPGEFLMVDGHNQPEKLIRTLPIK